jgi:2'-5' RNA ligase
LTPSEVLHPDAPEQARVFFALWPDEAVRGELDRLAADLHRVRGGRRTRAESIHLTLLFIGTVPRATLPALQAGAADLGLPAFELLFDRAECWRHNRIAYATTGEPPPALLQLVTGLEAMLDRLGIPYDRRPYKPHVTLVRNADCRPEDPPLQPIRWPAREFVLVESRLLPEGAQYVRLGRYPLWD